MSDPTDALTAPPTTPLGTVDAAAIVDVDRRGLVAMRDAAWALDWWIGAEDRWHHASVETAVRQSALETAPVIETAMRVPGGDIVHRCFGARATSGEWDDSCVVIEIENLASVPVALALVFRPDSALVDGSITSVAVDGTRVLVDGRVVAVSSHAPLRAAIGEPGDPARLLTAGDDIAADGLTSTARDGRIELAVVIPLTHTSTVRLMLPVKGEVRRTGMFAGLGVGAKVEPPEPAAEFSAPAASAVCGGWELHTEGTARVTLPEPLLDSSVVGAQRSLSLCFGDGFLDAAPAAPSSAVRAAELVEFLARSGVREPLGPLSRALVSEQQLNGTVRMADRSDAGTALILAAAPLLDGASELLIEDLLGPVAKAMHRLRKDPGAAIPSTEPALRRLAPVLESIGQPEVAEDALALATELAARPGDHAVPNGAGASTVQRAQSVRRLISGDTSESSKRLLKAVSAVAKLGTPLSVSDRYDSDGRDDGDVGCDPAALAALGNAVLDIGVADTPSGVDLWPAWPERWWGLGAEIHGVRTSIGVVSVAVRWHGDRPALLWDIEPGPGIDPNATTPVLRSSGLDPSWVATSWVGEALLSPVAPPVGIPGMEAPAPADPEASVEGSPLGDGLAPGEGQSFS